MLGAMEEGTCHAQVDDEAAPVGEMEEQILAPTGHILDAPPGQGTGKLGWRWPPNDTLRPRQYADPGEAAPHHPRQEIAAYGFHFGQLGHLCPL